MIQNPKSTAQYQQQVFQALLQTGIKQTAPGGKARAFADIVASALGESEARQFSNISQTLLPYATDTSLDFIGEIFGVTRIPATNPVVSTLDNNFQFYVRTGTFGSINNGQPIVIPVGIRIYTADSNGPVFVTDVQITLPAAASTQSFSAVSLNNGASGNAAANVFNLHNFTNYSDSSFGSLLITNNYGVISGRDAEDDTSYRFRIQLKLQSAGGAAQSDLQGALLTLPGIQDVVFEPLAGTFNVYVYGISPDVPPSLLQLVQAQIDAVSAFPLKGVALTPDLVGISLATTITPIMGVSQADQIAILALAAQAAANYINNLSVGGELVINEIASVMLNSDPRILDIGMPNQPLEEIFIWRSRNDNTRYSRFLVADYIPVTGERIVVEDITNAINLTIS